METYLDICEESKLSPFAANFVAVRYSSNQVKFFLNEELIHFDWCTNGVCNLKDVKEHHELFSECKTIDCPKEGLVDPIDSIDTFFNSIFDSLLQLTEI